jgi:hypothetical protein
MRRWNLSHHNLHVNGTESKAGKPSLEYIVDKENVGHLAWKIRMDSKDNARKYWVSAVRFEGKPVILRSEFAGPIY